MITIKPKKLGPLNEIEREFLMDAILTGRGIDAGDDRLMSIYLTLAEKLQSAVKKAGFVDSSDARRAVLNAIVDKAQRGDKPRSMSYRKLAKWR